MVKNLEKQNSVNLNKIEPGYLKTENLQPGLYFRTSISRNRDANKMSH